MPHRMAGRKGPPCRVHTPYGQGVNNPDTHPSDVLWACVEEGFHVGSRGGDFLGYVDRQSDGRYVAFDARSHAIGSFASLDEATSAVSASGSGASAGNGTDEGLMGTVQR